MYVYVRVLEVASSSQSYSNILCAIFIYIDTHICLFVCTKVHSLPDNIHSNKINISRVV